MTEALEKALQRIAMQMAVDFQNEDKDSVNWAKGQGLLISYNDGLLILDALICVHEKIDNTLNKQ